MLKHAFIWAFVIAYEIVLAALISKFFGHALDYALHYVLYICLFYFHCYGVLEASLKKKKTNWWLLILKVSAELPIYVACNVGIAYLLYAQGITPIWEFEFSTFALGNIYRFIHVVAASTAYWTTIHRTRKVKQLYRRRMATIIASRDKLLAQVMQVKNGLQSQSPYVFIKDNVKNDLVKINLNEFLYAKAAENYITVYTTKNSTLSYLTLKEFHQMVKHEGLLRVNRSYIANIDNIDRVNGYMITMSDGKTLEVKPVYRAAFDKKLAKKLLITDRNN